MYDIVEYSKMVENLSDMVGDRCSRFKKMLGIT